MKQREPQRLRPFLAGCLMLIVMALVTFPCARGAAQSNALLAQKFDPEGEFNVIGEPPPALTEVSAIQLFRDRRKSFFNRNGGLYTNKGVTYRFKTLTVSRQKLVFTTRAISGVSYSFTGRFLRGGVFATVDSDQWGKPFLEGHLVKLRGGQKVGEADLKFSYFGGT